MRNILLSFLLATTAAIPAYAQLPDRDARAAEREERRSERAEARKERSEARSDEARADRAQARTDRAAARADRVGAQEQNATIRDPRLTQPASRANINERGRPTLEDRRATRNAASSAQLEQRQRIEQRRAQTLEQSREQMSRIRERARPPAGARPDIPAPPPPVAATTKPVPAPQWSTTHWRRDSRYDWRDHRHRNRSLFHLGFYFDPFGWGYHRWGIGWRLWPSYYDRYYWMNDPWMYRLPYAPWPYRWIRYYNDALLVNVITGQVVDVEYDFFW